MKIKETSTTLKCHFTLLKSHFTPLKWLFYVRIHHARIRIYNYLARSRARIHQETSIGLPLRFTWCRYVRWSLVLMAGN